MAARFPSACFLLFLLLCTAFPCAAASPPLVLYTDTVSARLAGHIDILEDKTGTLTVADVSSPEADRLFRPPVKNRGFTTSVYWIRYTIKNKAEVEQRWLLELDMPNVKYIDLYVPTASGSYNLMQSGALRPMNIRTFQHRNPVFPIVVNRQGTTCYMRGDGDRSMLLLVTAWAPEAFTRMDHRRDLIAGCYFGAMLVMVAYNLFIFFSLRDRNYLYYILDIFCFALYVFFFKGFLVEFISAGMAWINNNTLILALLPILTGMVFCRNFLATARNVPFIDRILKIIMFVVILLIPAQFVVPSEWLVGAVTIIAPVGSLLLLIAGIVCLYRGYRPARYFIAARIFRFLGLIAFVLAINYILPWNLLTMSSLQIGSIIEVLLLSFALADRITIMRREKEEAQADAIRSSHLASLGELAAGVAHEINNPVNTIINSADLILESDDRGENRHDADVIKKHGRRIATIVSSLLFFARRPAQEKIPFAVAALLDGTLDMIGARLSKDNITITGQIPPDLPPVLVHPQQIEQVFLNILTNAMHALDEKHGGAYDVKRLDISASELTVGGRPFVRISFLDNGAGIPPELLNRITDAFVTTKQTGNGLGLSISRQIVAEHGGFLRIESTAGEYARVSVDLPVA